MKEHLRSAVDASGDSPDLTKNEVELVRFIVKGWFDWESFLNERSRPGPVL